MNSLILGHSLSIGQQAVPCTHIFAAQHHGKVISSFRLKAAQKDMDPKTDTSSNLKDSNFTLSPQAKKIFKEAQENILALNRSRTRALQELRAAHEKIADLEKRLEDAASQLSSLRGSPSNTSTQPHTSLQTQTICLVYQTGWDNVYLHCSVDGQQWTALPGLPLTYQDGDFPGKKYITIPGNKLEFVLNNGKGEFDTPNPYGDPDKPSNYIIESSGTWELTKGRLIRLS